MSNIDAKKWWQNEPWRMVQTNMREIDMEDIDADNYVKELKKFNATVAMINVGGILASYDTKVEDHTKSEFLHGDSLDKVIAKCKSEGIRVIARMDFSKIRREVFERHNDWAYRDLNGNIVDYNGNVHACICGDFQQKKAFEIMKEVLERFPIDGVFFNMGGFAVVDYSYNYHGICHCDACKKRFKEMYGLDLPDKDDLKDPTYGKYTLFKKAVTADYKDRMEKFIHSIRPDVAIYGFDYYRRESNTEYKRVNQPWIYSSSSNARMNANAKGEVRSSCPSVDFFGFYYRHIAVSPKLQAMREWQTLANCGLLDYYIIGRLDDHEDKSGYAEVKKVFNFHKKHEKVYMGMKLDAKALVVKTSNLSTNVEINGWVRALTESHIPLHECDDAHIESVEDITRYKAVILADIMMMSDEKTAIFDEYVKNGGTLIVVGNSGMMTEDAKLRGTIPFKSLGVPKVTLNRRDMLSAMLKLSKKDHKKFPLMADSELFFFGEEFVYADYDEKCEKSLKLIPPHRFGPPEMCYYTEVSEMPGLVERKYGKGKAVYIPWKPGNLYISEGMENTYAFMHGILTKVAGLQNVEDEPFTRMCEVTVAKNGEKTLVSLVNTSGSFTKSFFEPIPIYGIKLKIEVTNAPSNVRALSNNEEIPFSYDGKYIHFEVKRLDEYEGIIIK